LTVPGGESALLPTALQVAFRWAFLSFGLGYKNPDNPTWVNVVLIVGFVVAGAIAVGGYIYFGSKGARDD
jgi:hypothetical protein